MVDCKQLVEQTISDINLGRLSTGLAGWFANFATNHPDCLEPLIERALPEFGRRRWVFDAAFRFLTEESLNRLLPLTIRTLETEPWNNVAIGLLNHVCYHHPELIRPHLARTFALPDFNSQHYEWRVWRGTGQAYAPFFRDVLNDPTQPLATREKAWRCLLGTRDLEAVQYATERFHLLGVCGEMDWYLASVGFCFENGKLRQLYPGRELHLFFDKAYFDGPLARWQSSPNLARYQELLRFLTWHGETEEAITAPFGGFSSTNCGVCGGCLHHLITLEQIPTGTGIASLGRLELATCLSCLGWEQQNLFYHHDETGQPTSIGYSGEHITPQFPAVPLLTTQVRLAELPAAWRGQDISVREWNSNRIGSEPWWVQNPEYPSCPQCQKKMAFLMQLSSNLPTVNGNEWWWGSGGTGYICWCDACRVSGHLWQCT